MFCPKCHTHIIDDSTKFCSRCGESLEKKKRRSSFSTGSSFSSISSSSTFKYMSKYGKKSNGNKFNYENIKNEEALERVLNNEKENCNINQPANANNHNDQFNYNVKYSGVTKKRQSHDEQFNYSKNYSGVTKKGKTHEEQYNYSQRYSGTQPTTQQRTYEKSYTSQPQINSEDSYRLAFIGPNKESIIKSSFSVPALLFGPLYLVYRKMIGIGLLIELIILIIQAAFGSDAASTIQIFIHVILAFKFRTMYLNFTNKKVKGIITTNQNKTSTEIAYECSQNGKTLGIKPIITFAIVFYILSLFATAYYEVNQKSVENTDNSTVTPTYNTNMNKSKYTIGSYGFKSSYDDQITVTDSNNAYINLEYSPSNTKKCIFSVEKIYSNDSAYTYINNQKQYSSLYNISTIRSNVFNDNTWYYMHFYNYNGQIEFTIYAMKDYTDNEIYTFKVLPYNLNSCNNIAQNMMNNFEKNY